MIASLAALSRFWCLNLLVEDFQPFVLVQQYCQRKYIGFRGKKGDRLWCILTDILALSKARGAAGLVDALFRSRLGYHRLILRRNLLHKMMSV